MPENGIWGGSSGHTAETIAKMTGRKHSAESRARMKIAKQNISVETRTKMSLAQQNRSVETLTKMSIGGKGKHRKGEKRIISTNHRESIIASNKERKNTSSPEQMKKMIAASHLKIQCPHCKREISKNTMNQWHFEKCKFLTEDDKIKI